MDVEDISKSLFMPGLQSNEGEGMKIGGEFGVENLNVNTLPGPQYQHLTSNSNTDIMTSASTSSTSLDVVSHNSVLDIPADMTATTATSNTFPSSASSSGHTAISHETETDASNCPIPLSSGVKICFGVSMKANMKKSKKRPAPPGFGGLFGSEY